MKHLIQGMCLACLFSPSLSSGQTAIDALRYSQQTFGYTARALSMGGAFGALGADYTSIATNPAGIGMYRKSEFTISMGFNNRETESTFTDQTISKSKFSFDMPNVGMVFSFNKKQEHGWKQFGFGIGYHRTANFNSESYYVGTNESNSMLDAFTDEIRNNGGATELGLYNDYPFDAYLAYMDYLLNPDTLEANQYITVIPNGGAVQSRSVVTRGGMGEFSLAFGGNFNERVCFGVSMAFPTIGYDEESVFSEQDRDNTISVSDTLNFQLYRFYQYLHTHGSGFNAKFGLIVRPADWLRIGASFQTPTWYSMTDNYRASMSSSFEGNQNYLFDSPDGVYSYHLRTPFKAIGSIAVIMGKLGLVSIDYEATNYSSADLNASDYHFSTENSIINKAYSGFASNIRGGVEIKLDHISLRAGAAYYSTPFDDAYSDSRYDQHVLSYAGGIGFRSKRLFVDVGYAWSKRNEFFSPYTLSYEDVPGVIQGRTDNRVITTFGIRF